MMEIGKNIPKEMMYEFIYIRVDVLPADPKRYSALAGILEKISGQSVPDVIPHTDSGAISFKHCRLMAKNEEEAYDIGYKLLTPQEKGSVINDYVIKV